MSGFSAIPFASSPRPPFSNRSTPTIASKCSKRRAKPAPPASEKACNIACATREGTWRILESTASTIKNVRGEVEKLVIVNRDVTQRVEAEEKLAHHALHDGLTELPNRRLFLDRLQRCHAHTRRDPDFHYAILLADIDGFKALNHSLGSAAGDQLLIEMSLRLQACLREGDVLARPANSPTGEIMVARFGGDEFAILLEGCTEPSNVLRIAERAQAAVAAPLLLNQGLIRCTLGVGSAISAASHTRADDTLRDAETALRRAQAFGACRSELFDPAMHNRAVNRLKLESELRTALNRSQFRILYQPIFRIEPRSAFGRIRGSASLATSRTGAHRTQRISRRRGRHRSDGHD
jgi:diguanylate cyclase (GGDEF)-like protein